MDSAVALTLPPAACVRGDGYRDDSSSPSPHSTTPRPQRQPPASSAPSPAPRECGIPIRPQAPHQQQLLRRRRRQRQQQQQHSRTVKRPRPVKSCAECRKRKLRCDRLLPCSQCQKSARLCRYAADRDSSNLSDASDDADEPARARKRACPWAPAAAAAQTPAKTADQPGLPSLEDLSMRMERLEKQFRARSPATDCSGPRGPASLPGTTRDLTVKRHGQATRFFGQSSARVLLSLFQDAKAFLALQHDVAAVSELYYNFRALHRSLRDGFHDAMAPITVFVDSIMPIQKRMTDILPKKSVCDRLVASYFTMAKTIYRIIHYPTFSEQYDRYWQGSLRFDAFLPQLLSLLSISSRFETRSKGLAHERAEAVHIPTACALVRIWLDGLKGKQLVEVTTIQVELLLLHAQRFIEPRVEDGWTQLGSTVRLVMTMGLHRDPSEFEPHMTVFLGELRRRLWFTIVDMDTHQSLACNLPCLVRDGDFTCRPPRNLNDAELYPAMRELPPTRPIDEATDNQMQVYAAMTLGVRMRAVPLINRIHTMRDYHKVVEVGAKLERFLDVSHVFPRRAIISSDSTEKSRRWRRLVILNMLVRRPLLALYRPLAMGVADVPAHISRTYLRSSMAILNYLDELDPGLAHFDDIAVMYHQILKRDIIQAALSVCFYIQAAVRPDTDGLTLGHQALRMSPDPPDDPPSCRADVLLWSPARLIDTAQRALDLLLTHMAGRDTKDVVCIALVLETVKTPEPDAQEILRSLNHILHACLRATKPNRDKLHARADWFPADNCVPGWPAYGYSARAAAAAALAASHQSEGTPSSGDDFGAWLMWEGWE